MTDAELAGRLKAARTIAVVGLSDKPDRPSHEVAAYLQSQGYRILPVNPALREVLGEKAYASVDELPAGVDVVDVFRRAEDTPPIAAATAAYARRFGGSPLLWLQEGIVSQAAAGEARAAGLDVVMDRCILKEHRRLRATGAL